MESAFSILITCIYVIGSLNLGLLVFYIYQKFTDNIKLSNSVIVSSFLLGVGILSIVWLFLGLLMIFKKIYIIGILTALLLSSIIFKEYYRQLLHDIRSNFNKILQLSIIWKVLISIIFIQVILYGVGALNMPVVGDAEAFYMVWPKIISASERIIPQPNYYNFSQIGLCGELHSAALLSIANQNAAKFFTWFISLGSLMLLLSICSMLKLTIKGKISAIIMLLTSTTFTYYITDGKVDLYSAAFGLAAFFWVLQIESNIRKIVLVLTGVFLGFSIVAKFSYIPVMIPGIFLLVFYKVYLIKSNYRFEVIFTSFLIVGIFSLLPIIPNFIKNAILFQEPFAPFIFLYTKGYSFIGQAWYSPEITKHILITYPIALVFGKYPMQAGNISPLVLAFLPFAIFLNFPIKESLKKSIFVQLSVIAVISVGIWMIVMPYGLAPRYILATLILFIPLAAKCVDGILNNKLQHKYLNAFIVICLLFSLSLNFIETGNFLYFIKTLKKNYSEGQFAGEYYKSCQFINKNLSPGERIFFAGYYTYHLREDLLQCLGPSKHENTIITQILYSTQQKKEELLISNGFNYVVIQKSSHADLFKFANREKNKSTQVKPIIVYEDPSTVIYKLIDMTKKDRRKLIAKQINPPAWDIVENK